MLKVLKGCQQRNSEWEAPAVGAEVWDRYVERHGRRAFAGARAPMDEVAYFGSSARELDLFVGMGACLAGEVCIDLGCGDGRISARLSNCFDQVVSLDISRAAIDRVATGGPALANALPVQAAATAVPVRSNSVDVVLCTYVLQHLSHVQVQATITEVLRVLKPGGVFCVQVAASGTFRWSRDALLGVARAAFQALAPKATRGTGWALPAFERPWRASYFGIDEVEELFAVWDIRRRSSWREHWVVATKP